MRSGQKSTQHFANQHQYAYPTETNYTKLQTYLYLYSLYVQNLGGTVHSNTLHTMLMVSLCNHTCTYCHIFWAILCCCNTKVQEGRKGGRNDRTHNGKGKDWWEGRKKGLECSKGIEQKKKKVQHASMKWIISPKRITCIYSKRCHTERTRTEHRPLKWGQQLTAWAMAQLHYLPT